MNRSPVAFGAPPSYGSSGYHKKSKSSLNPKVTHMILNLNQLKDATPRQPSTTLLTDHTKKTDFGNTYNFSQNVTKAAKSKSRKSEGGGHKRTRSDILKNQAFHQPTIIQELGVKQKIHPCDKESARTKTKIITGTSKRLVGKGIKRGYGSLDFNDPTSILSSTGHVVPNVKHQMRQQQHKKMMDH
jgi:hypothetical protein